ncbi:LytTR family DNA-binding domain-containing protein [Lentilactobacillus raoultii]|uniref:LytTR family DNA-binding domain-containing protein n=1 Tax=Lentilactobacillus raoultii TaxID=1987503 RepID=A0ABW3PK83_9LACO|nr:LytTR family DNA-binding domain-containing protein [Lentilactobacillus raoultii]
MKVRVEIDNELTDKEIVIKTPHYDAQVAALYQSVQKSFGQHQPLVFYKGASEYYLDLSEILFFETDGRQVLAHTSHDQYVIHHRLYELEELLTGRFARISKSAIINLDQIYALTHSLSSTVVRFQNSPKRVYVSRRYYKALKDRLERRR